MSNSKSSHTKHAHSTNVPYIRKEAIKAAFSLAHWHTAAKPSPRRRRPLPAPPRQLAAVIAPATAGLPPAAEAIANNTPVSDPSHSVPFSPLRYFPWSGMMDVASGVVARRR
jgi:hypothetical protein